MAFLIVLALMTDAGRAPRPHRGVGGARLRFKAGGLGDAAEEVRKVRALPRVVGAAPVVLGQGLAKSAGTTEFITIKGIDPVLELSVTNVAQSMTSGTLDALTPVAGSLAGIVVGRIWRKTGRPGDGIEVLRPREH
jgi:lipoprotein-releasing system permease protein